MIDGFYRVAFTGHYGSGFGLLVMREGVIAGADIAGATYDGTYELQGDAVNLNVTMRAPAGITPVQTGIPLASPAEIAISTSIAENFANGQPALVETPLGTVNVAFVKIREL